MLGLLALGGVVAWWQWWAVSPLAESLPNDTEGVPVAYVIAAGFGIVLGIGAGALAHRYTVAAIVFVLLGALFAYGFSSFVGHIELNFEPNEDDPPDPWLVDEYWHFLTAWLAFIGATAIGVLSALSWRTAAR